MNNQVRKLGFRASVVAAACLWAATAYAEETFKIGLAAANLFTAPTFAASDLGYFKDAGLNVEITVFRGGAAGQEALSAGAVDMITYVASGMALAVSKGAKEKIVAAIEPSPYAWHLLVDAKSPYKTVADLAGKKIGVTTKASTSDLLASWALDRAKVTAQTVPVGAGQIPALKSGQVDAIAINPSSLSLLADGSARSLVDFGKEMEPSLPDVWVASQEAIDKRPEAVSKALGAIYKALDHMRNNKEWALKFIKDFTKEENDKVVELSYQQGTLAQSRDGTIDPKWIDTALQQTLILSNTDAVKALKPEDIYTRKFIPIDVAKK